MTLGIYENWYSPYEKQWNSPLTVVAHAGAPLLIHSPRYNTPLHDFGIDKPFALDRGTLVQQKLAAEFGDRVSTVEPDPISVSDALLVHTAEYLQTLKDPATWREIFELSDAEYDPARATRPLNELFDDIAFKSGGTMLAVELALRQGLAANLGGGYHHAFPNEGRGFCVLHDIAIAIRSAKKRNLCRRCLVIDVDFHQGDGTALIFRDDDSVFTLSIHSAEGWPDVKQRSDLDIEITSSETGSYIGRLEAGLKSALKRFSPDLVMFVAGSDAYELDVLPGTAYLKLSLEQMKKRDELVLNTFAGLGVPLAMVYAGGYGPDVWEVHYFATRRLVELAL